ncbi:MAG: amidohydrolase family protein [Verrucomicrobia bacterium]|nr:amidohydrolase family protein [Verrucomicrobiota bacterium]MDE3099398.1 amidohydrolase family protein [Verrucomicrobiota bacterium]
MEQSPGMGCGKGLDKGARCSVIRARVVYPGIGRPIDNGAVAVSGGAISAAGKWRDLKALGGGPETVLDAGERALLPGLINAHCHLDYTGMAGLWPPPKGFTDWIPLMLAAKAEYGYADYARSWLAGARMLGETGTTTVADIESVPELLPEAWDSTPLRVFSFLEMTGVRSKKSAAGILGEALEKIKSLSHPQCGAGLSPHAPYSTFPGLLRLCAAAAAGQNLRVSMHVAESLDEFEMFARARGPMFNWLERNGRDMGDCGGASPVARVGHAGLLGENLLAVHVNALAPGDVELLAQKGVHVVHCPRSHDYFGHPPFQRAALAAAGVNLCLGTDSLATIRKHDGRNPELDMFAEMRALASKDAAASPQDILQMATVNGARALGLAGKAGALVEGAFADLIAMPFSGKVSGIAEAAVHFSGRVEGVMIGGQWILQPE